MKASLFISLLFCLTSPAYAADWPQWRGPERDGRNATPWTADWPDSLNLVWSTRIGTGHASPIVADDKVYVHARNPAGDEVAYGIDLKTGTTLWQQALAVPYTMNPAAYGHGKGPKSTPLVHGDQLYTLGITGILSCHDRHTGALQWRIDITAELSPPTGPDNTQSAPLYGTATSPLYANGSIIAYLGRHDEGPLRAFDAQTGTEHWSWHGDAPAYSSPITVEIDGVKQLVTQSQRFNLGLDLATGKELWKIPYATAWDQNSVSPIAYGDLLIFSGIDKGITAYRLTRDDNSWQAEQAWHNADLSMYMSSPVLDGHLLYGFSHYKKGQYFCLDARSGATLWTSPGRQGDNASIIDSGDRLLLLNTEAQLTVADKGDTGFAIHKQYSLAPSPTWAHPTVLDGQLLIKDADRLYLWSAE